MFVDRWTKPDWCTLCVLDQVEWSTTSQPPTEQYWQRPDQCPPLGERRAIKVDKVPIANTFWVLFQPALSFLNGFEDFPEELPCSAIVEVRLIEHFADGWVVVEVLQLVTLNNLEQFLSSCASETLDFWELGDNYTKHYSCANGWHHFSWNCESEAGFWIVWHDQADHSALLMYGHFMAGELHQSYAGHRIMSETERAELDSLILRAKSTVVRNTV